MPHPLWGFCCFLSMIFLGAGHSLDLALWRSRLIPSDGRQRTDHSQRPCASAAVISAVLHEACHWVCPSEGPVFFFHAHPLHGRLTGCSVRCAHLVLEIGFGWRYLILILSAGPWPGSGVLPFSSVTLCKGGSGGFLKKLLQGLRTEMILPAGRQGPYGEDLMVLTQIESD